jgi:16S rRNA (uracil1498-N3)-methyltransferase
VSRAPRLHLAEAAAGARFVLPDHLAHHVRDVLRLRRGDAVHVFDGAGHEFEGHLQEVSRREVGVHLGGAVETLPEPTLRVVLALSPLKGDRMELVIQKATELGVAQIRPVVTARTDAIARPALHGTRQERWEKVASGAAEQCGRAVVPAIAPTATLSDLAAAVLPDTRLVLVETPGAPALRSVPPPDGAVVLVVGPAGGWETREVEQLADAGFRAVSLGPRILRAETAAIAAVTAAQALWGDLG